MAPESRATGRTEIRQQLLPQIMPVSQRDYYEILGLSRNASGEDIKRAYRKLAMQYHPDRNGGDKEAEIRFKEAAEAYAVLSDPGKRRRYDQFGHAGVAGAHQDFSRVDPADIFSMFEEIFGGLGGGFGGFGGGRRRTRGPAPGVDLETRVELTLEEVAAGTEKTLEFERLQVCESCTGSGVKPDARPSTCPTCGGQGRVAQQGFGGMFRMVTTCPMCRGRGAVVDPADACRTCGGSGRTQQKRKVTLKVPAGVHEGQAVRLAGEGEAGDPGAEPGDLLCYIIIAEHPVFTRHHNDLVCQVPIGFTQAALGATIDVPVLRHGAAADDAAENNGHAPARRGKGRPTTTLDIPAGTQHGQVFKLKGQGLPDIRNSRRGDLIVQTLIEIPRKLTSRQEELLREFAETEHDDARHLPQRKGFLDKLKEMIGAD